MFMRSFGPPSIIRSWVVPLVHIQDLSAREFRTTFKKRRYRPKKAMAKVCRFGIRGFHQLCADLVSEVRSVTSSRIREVIMKWKHAADPMLLRVIRQYGHRTPVKDIPTERRVRCALRDEVRDLKHKLQQREHELRAVKHV